MRPPLEETMTSDEAKALVVAAKDAVFAIEKALPDGEQRVRFYRIRVELGNEGFNLLKHIQRESK